MRNLRNPQLERGEVRIEDIKLNHKSRDDMPVLLGGLQYLYSQEASRDRSQCRSGRGRPCRYRGNLTTI